VVPDGLDWTVGDDEDVAEEFVEANDAAGTLRSAVFLSRMVPIAMAALTGIAIYALAARLAGRAGGVVAAALWFFTPLVAGLGHLDGLDVPFTLAVVGTCLAVDRLLEGDSPGRAVVVGVALGGCLLTRTSGLVVVAAVVGVVLVAGRRRPRQALLRTGTILLVAWVLLWVGYRALAPTGSGTSIASRGDRDHALHLLPLPAEYVNGLLEDDVIVDDRSFFLAGRYSPDNQWWYWPVAVVVKLPPTLFVLLPLGVVGWWGLDPARRRRGLASVVAPAVVLGAATVVVARPIGVRYLLPVVALGVVAIAPVVTLLARWRALRFAVPVVLAVQLGFLVESVPHSLAWTAPPFRPAYGAAADSNVDWGQDVYRLRDWVEAHPRTWVAWLGPTSPIALGRRDLLDAEPRDITGWVAVSATTLTVYRHVRLSWLRAYCPVDTIGASVLLYYFEEPPSPAPGPDAPADECAAGASRRG